MDIPVEKMDKLVIAKWELFLEDNITKIPKEEIDKYRNVFYMGYQKGHTDVVDTMREIYNDDPCEFDNFFHLDSSYESRKD
ncbi:hypothetical protein ABE073_04465 [Lederbergia citrisecunda]|uniref:hypothetical protein n=1 Tax=Lederbergia citrisecunda TaxID=2833583 RepID=UPI003D2D799C